MSKKQHEINDDEIRIISACEVKPGNIKRRPLKLWLLIILSVIILGFLIFIFTRGTDRNPAAEKTPIVKDESTPGLKGFTAAVDTTINQKGLLILTPENARPRLIVGNENLTDPDIVLAMQAADIRGDNGQIAGTFVINGEVISRGEAKAGFCSIINGEITLGVSDATPMLEQTLTDGGYFFRQYPLVVSGQIVENKPQGRAIRKALADMDGKICVIVSKERLTYHDFSQLLVDAGVRTAISLVGSSSHGFYVDEKGEKFEIGDSPWTGVEYVNYIIWE